MRRLIIEILILSGILCYAGGSFAADAPKFHNALSLQGYTGILNTPTAHVTTEGDLYALYANQEESKWRDKVPFQKNYFINVGFFNFLEVGGTLMEAPGVNRDLSANFKLTTEPIFRKYPYAPVLGLGMQDFKGGASFLKTKYAVLSEDLWRLRLSAGYGMGPDHLEGVFGGAEFKLHDWVYLLADYDTDEKNVGARVVLPHFWKIPVSFTATAKSSLTHKPEKIELAFGFSLPLDFKVRKPKAVVASPKKEKKEITHQFETTVLKVSGNVSTPNIKTEIENLEKENLTALKTDVTDLHSEDVRSKLILLRDALVKAGFMNVRVGDFAGTNVIVEYENVRFNHNEMDALGVVVGMSVEALKDTKYNVLRLIIRKKNIGMLKISMPLRGVKKYLENPKYLSTLRSQITVSSNLGSYSRATFVDGDQNSSFLSTSFVLWPGLSTIIGAAENGEKLFEYRLSLKPEIYLNLWKGALLNARWDVPIKWSDKMENDNTDSVMERLMLFQGVKLLPNLMANFGVGVLQHQNNGTLNELVFNPGDGEHRFKATQAWGKNEKTNKETKSYLGSYKYNFAPLDLSLEATGGKFWFGDIGFALELKRFFGDAAFSVYYKDSKTPDKKHWQAGGVMLAFPLTPEKDMKHYYKMQLRGTEEWSYGQETTFMNNNGADSSKSGNFIPDVPIAVAPLLTGSLYNQYYNRDRLNASYIKNHLDRMRNSWIKYKDKI